MLAAAPCLSASAPPLPLHHPAMQASAAAAAISVSTPFIFAPLLPFHNRRRHLNPGTRPAFLKLCTKSSLNTASHTLTISSKRSSLGKMQIGPGGRIKLSNPGLTVPCMQYQLPHRRQTISYSRLPSAATPCANFLHRSLKPSSTCSAGQTQTIERQSTKSVISLLPGIERTPKLDQGGGIGPPRDSGGGGGGGGGGWPSSGGFFLFAFLLFLRFLKDKEEEKKSTVTILDIENE